MGNWAEKAKSGGSKRIEGKVVEQYWSNTFPFGESEPGDNLYWVLKILPEGADTDAEPEVKALYLGSGQYLRIVDEDGEDVEADDDGAISGPVLMSTDEDGSPRIYDQGEVMSFILSLEELGFPADTRFPDPSTEKKIDLRGILGTRLIIGDEIDRASQIKVGRDRLAKKLGPAKAAKATEDECLEAGKRQVTKGKHKGKSFNLTHVVCLKVVEVPDAEGDDDAPKKGKKAKAEKVEPKAAGKKKAKDEDDEDDEPAEEAEEEVDEDEDDDEEEESDDDEQSAGPSVKTLDKVMKAILTKEKTKKAKKSALVLLVTRHCSAVKMDRDEATAVRKAFNDDKQLAAMAKRGVIEKFTPGKDPVIELA